MALQLERGKHIVGTPPLLRWLRREFPEFDGKRKAELGMYFHVRRNRWVVFTWINKLRGTVHEILPIGTNPSDFSGAARDTLELRLRRPENPDQCSAHLRRCWYEQDSREALDHYLYMESMHRTRRDDDNPGPGNARMVPVLRSF